MNPSTVKQNETKSVPSKVATEAANVASTKEQLLASKSELDAIVKAPENSTTSKLLETKAIPSNVAAENPTTPVSKEKQIISSNILDSILTDTSNVVIVSNRFTAAREPNSKFSIVNHKNSNRCKINIAIQEKLNLIEGDVVQVIVKDKMVLLLKSSTEKGIVMKEHGNLYSKELVERVTDMFQFDFSQQSTHHLTEVTFQKWNEQLVAILTP